MPPRRLWLEVKLEFDELADVGRAELAEQLELRRQRDAQRNRENVAKWRDEQRLRGLKPPPPTADQRERRRLQRIAIRAADPELHRATRRDEHAARVAREREAIDRVQAAHGMGLEPTAADLALADRRRRRQLRLNARARARRLAAQAAGLPRPVQAPRTPEQLARARARYRADVERLRAIARLREKQKREADPVAYRQRFYAWRNANREHVRAQNRIYAATAAAKRRRER
jgi:hypothetical protein